MYKYVVLIAVGCAVFLASAFAAFYEGSALADNPWEWSYSTPVTSLMGEEVQQASDISSVDYFYYAAKYEPAFPLIMIASILYIVLICGFILLRLKNRKALLYFGIVAVISFGAVGAMLEASSSGSRWFVILFAITAVVSSVYAIIAGKGLIRQAKV
jgi:hypothetical protein